MWSPWLAKADASLYAKNVRQYMLEKHRELEFLASFEPPDGRGQNWLPLIQKIPKALPVGHPWWKINRCGSVARSNPSLTLHRFSLSEVGV